VPQEVVRKILDHDSAEMTAHYARLSDTTVRRHWEQAAKSTPTARPSPSLPTDRLYLATVIDCFSRQVIGWSMAEHLRAELVVDALDMAAKNGTLDKEAIFHSDRGTQYQCR